jgi:hypothetical protein
MNGTIRGRDVTAHYYGLHGRTIDGGFSLAPDCPNFHGTWSETRTKRGGLLRGHRIYMV